MKEAFVSKTTTGDGSVWDVAFSHDAQQRCCTSPTATTRKSGSSTAARSRPIGSFGDGGRYPGHFYGVGSIAVDSKGNVYTGENLRRQAVQKFVKTDRATCEHESSQNREDLCSACARELRVDLSLKTHI